MATAQKYVLGRGKLYLALFASGSQIPLGERYLGNTPSFALTIASENLDHYSSDDGIREKDDSVPIQVNRSGNFETDNIDVKNVALFFFGSADVLAQSAEEGVTETFADIEQGLVYQLGISEDSPSGVRGVENVVVKVAAATKTLGDDYTLDPELGRVIPVVGGGIANLADMIVEYDVVASTREQVMSGSMPVEGALRFVAHNPKGADLDYYMPWVKLTPNGDYALKGEEWQKIPFNLEVLKRTDRPAIMVDGRPTFS